MLKYKILPLINETARDLDMDPAIVKDIIDHEFKTIQANIIDPKVVGIRLEDFGKFYYKFSWYKRIFPSMAERYRKGTLTKEVLQKYLSIRTLVTNYHLSRKYKTRFGSWHWK